MGMKSASILISAGAHPSKNRKLQFGNVKKIARRHSNAQEKHPLPMPRYYIFLLIIIKNISKPGLLRARQQQNMHKEFRGFFVAISGGIERVARACMKFLSRYSPKLVLEASGTYDRTC